MKPCGTCHNACACREAMFAERIDSYEKKINQLQAAVKQGHAYDRELEAENKRFKEALDRLAPCLCDEDRQTHICERCSVLGYT